MLDICISGATGWTGSELVRGVLAAPDLNLSSAVARASAGKDVGTVIGEITGLVRGLDNLLFSDV